MPAIASRWYWLNGSNQAGPITWDQLQDLAKQGKLRANDWVWREGAPQWQPAGTARGDDKGPTSGGTVPPPPPVVQQTRAQVLDVPVDEIADNPAPKKSLGRGTRRMIYGTVFFLSGVLGIVLTYDPERMLFGGRYMPFRVAIIFGIIQFCRGIGEAGSDD